MPQGSPNISAPPAVAVSTTEASGEEPVEEQQPQSVEEVEAIWKNRVSQKDRAHAAEQKALRDQIAAMEARLATKQQADAANATEADQWKARYEEERQARQAEREQALAEVRAAKYPFAAEALDPAVLASMDEAKLAGLNARLDESGAPPPTGIMDPNSAPKRTPAPPKSLTEKSVAELESDLQKHSPSFVERIRT